MNYEKKYKEASKWVESIFDELTHGQQMQAEAFFPELKESEDEKIRKDLITFLDDVWHLGKNANFDKWGKADCSNWIAWLEKQGKKKTLNADKVIAWLVGNIIDFEDYVRAFKKDFGL